MRLASASIGTTAVLALVAILFACEGDPEGACEVDTDCRQGLICRDKQCGPVGADASVPDASVSTPCAQEGAGCSSPDECCSRTCTSGLCASSTPIPSTPTCRGLSELCQNDCCANLTCTNGVCR